ncbi:FtsX-like permease family protein [Mobilitalea sibirica]|uniref:FtsX-like permease family protein n=1 Tax=Mobilitalea sibirica TaxID=1462919 RepID=UPI0018D41B72|nr:FtsX-like permease family protein [Mobilitalea sibirica]
MGLIRTNTKIEGSVLVDNGESVVLIHGKKGEGFINLLKVFIKLTLKKNIKSYINCSLILLAAVFLIVIFTGLSDNLKNQYTDTHLTSFYLSYKFSGFQIVFNTAAVLFVMYQYYKIMTKNILDYSIIKALGASKNILRGLIMLQTLLLLVLTVPFGLFLGVLSAEFIQHLIKEFSSLEHCYNLNLLSSGLPLAAAVLVSTSIIAGVITIYSIEKRLPSQILKDQKPVPLL